MEIDDERFSRTMADFARSMTSDTDTETTLRRLTDAAVELVPGAECADILMVTGESKFESHASTSDLPRRMGELQASLREGPCVDAAMEADVAYSADLRTEKRWPRYAAGAVEEGVLSTLSFRLFTHGKESAALNLFAGRSNAFDAEAFHIGGVLASHASIAVLASRKELQFKSALASRDLIGQAKGMLMERFGIDSDSAFRTIVRLSQETNTPLARVAARIVEAGPAER